MILLPESSLALFEDCYHRWQDGNDKSQLLEEGLSYHVKYDLSVKWKAVKKKAVKLPSAVEPSSLWLQPVLQEAHPHPSASARGHTRCHITTSLDVVTATGAAGESGRRGKDDWPPNQCPRPNRRLTFDSTEPECYRSEQE